MSYARRLAPLGLLLIVLGFRLPDRPGSTFFLMLLLGNVFLFIGVLLRALIRCPLCGVRLQGSSTFQAIPRLQRLDWMRSLDSCPLCLDDGSATPESRRRWLQSGRMPEGPYWSVGRLTLAVLAIFLMLALASLVGEVYRVKP